MQKEYWVNVYDFSFDPDKSKPQHSFSQPFKSRADALEDYIDWRVFKQIPIYRIHVKMKPVIEYKATVIGNCGKPHTVEEWGECGMCRYELNSYKKFGARSGAIF